MLNVNFSHILKSLIKEKRIKLKDLAADIGVSKQAISDYCLGNTTPKYPVLIKLAEYFGVSCDYLLIGCELNESAANKDIGLSGSALHCLKKFKEYSDFKFFDNMLADPDFYLAVAHFRGNLQSDARAAIDKMHSALKYTNKAAALKTLQDLPKQFKQAVAIDRGEFLGYFEKLVNYDKTLKDIEKIIKTEINNLINAPDTPAPSDTSEQD